MLKRLIKLIKKNWVFILLAFIVFLSYGKTLQMYWWVDDWGLLFKMIHPQSTPGNLGGGLLGDGAYRYLATPFIILFPLLKYSTFSYFLIGLFLYFLASICVYIFVGKLTKNKFISIASAAIFASGYIGSYALYRLSNSYQFTLATIFILLTGISLIKYFDTNKLKYYFFSLIFFISSLEFLFLRVNGIIIFTLGVSAFFYVLRKVKKLKRFILEQIPFFFIYYIYFFKGFAIGPGITVGASKGFLTGVIEELFIKKHIEYISNFAITLTRMIYPSAFLKDFFIYFNNLLVKNAFQNSVYQYKSFFIILTILLIIMFVCFQIKERRKILINLVFSVSLLFLLFVFAFIFLPKESLRLNVYEGYTALLGMFTLIATVWYCSIFIKKARVQLLLILFSLIIIVSNILTYFIYNPATSLDSISRYVVPALVGCGLFWATIISVIKNKYIKVLLIAIICFSFIRLTNKDEDYILKFVSCPDKQGYELIKSTVSKVDENTVFHIETSADPVYKNNVLGSMPQLGISIMKGYGDNTIIVDSYDELISRIKAGKTSIDNVYTFYHDQNGYKDTTQDFRRYLQEGSKPNSLIKQPYSANTLVDKKNEGTVGVNPELEFTMDQPSLTPSILNLKMVLTPLDIYSLKYPYFDFSAQYPNQISQDTLKGITPPLAVLLSSEKILLALRLASEIQDFRNSTKVTVSSFWGGKESKYLIDGKEDTNWEADNAVWNAGTRPQNIVIDLGKIKQVNKFVWINHYYLSTPTVYTLYGSTDGSSWFELKKVVQGGQKDSGEIIIDKFSSREIKFFKMSIFDTSGGNGPDPGVRELWVSGITEDLDMVILKGITDCPFCYIPDYKTAVEALDRLKNMAKARIFWTTDRDKNFSIYNSQEFQIYLDGKSHCYTIYLPAQGTVFEKLKIDNFPVPLRIDLRNVSIKTMNIEEFGLYNAFLP